MKITRRLLSGALACCLGAGAAMAQDGPPPGMPPMPPGALAQINLGRAGLFASFYSDEQWGTTQGRIGQSRGTVATATAPGGPTTGFEDGSTTAVVTASVQKALPDGKSYLRFEGTFARPDGRPNLVEQEASNPSIFVHYMTFPNPDTMLSFGLFAERSDVDNIGSGTVLREAVGVRGDVLRKFNDNWAASARAEYSLGESDLRIPAIGFRHVQDDDRIYTQAELIGTFGTNDVAAMPEGWVLRPVLGINFQHNIIEATADSFGNVSSGVAGDTENYGMVWANIGVQKQPVPGKWAFNAWLGLEYEYVNDLDDFVDESTYVAGQIGAFYLTKTGQQILFNYTRHQGLNGNRWSETLLATLNVPI